MLVGGIAVAEITERGSVAGDQIFQDPQHQDHAGGLPGIGPIIACLLEGKAAAPLDAALKSHGLAVLFQDVTAQGAPGGEEVIEPLLLGCIRHAQSQAPGLPGLFGNLVCLGQESRHLLGARERSNRMLQLACLGTNVGPGLAREALPVVPGRLRELDPPMWFRLRRVAYAGAPLCAGLIQGRAQSGAHFQVFNVDAFHSGLTRVQPTQQVVDKGPG